MSISQQVRARRRIFLQMNRSGQVPVIQDGAVTLADANAILVYLAKQYGDETWLPNQPVRAAAVQRWLSVAAGMVAFGPAGDTPTIADIANYTYIAHSPEGNVSLTPYPRLRAWLSRIEGLPGFVPMPKTPVALAA